MRYYAEVRKMKLVLKKCLVELYNKFHINWSTDISTLSATDFPIFSDLYEFVRKKAEQEPDVQAYSELSLLLYDIAKGSDSFIWNGHSTVKTNSRCIYLDTNALQETSDSIKRTQYFNLLTWCWEQMCCDRTEKVMLICDECYLLIDQKVPQSLIYLRNVMKRARKYEGSLAIISHSVIDFLDSSIKQYGQALLDVP